MNWVILLAGFVLGGAWRRWEGANVTGFLGHRWLKLALAGLGGEVLTHYWVQDSVTLPLVSVIVATLLVAGWSLPAQFGDVDGPFPWALSGHYGVITTIVAFITFFMMGRPEVLLYSLVGLLAPVGYYFGRRFPTVWTEIGEVWAGSLLYGFIPILGLVIK